MNNPTEKAIRAILAILPALAIVGIIFFILITNNIDPLKDVLLVLVGTLVAMAKEGSGYFLGSSQGSADKTEAMIEQARDNASEPKKPDDEQ